MYRGFDLKKLTINDTTGHWYEQGMDLFNDNKQKVISVLKNFALNGKDISRCYTLPKKYPFAFP
jgi:hypothetical protein